MRVITFNILSPPLCNKKTFHKNADDELVSHIRLKKILDLLKDWIFELPRPIICLQEVSIADGWRSSLELFFIKNKYIFLVDNYGNGFNGYMGVAIAIPSEAYKLVKIHYQRIGSLISSSRTSSSASSRTSSSASSSVLASQLQSRETVIYNHNPYSMKVFGYKIPEWLVRYLYMMSGVDVNSESDRTVNVNSNSNSSVNDIDFIGEASKRNNRAIYVELEDGTSGRRFSLATYHVPCCIDIPEVKRLHIEALFGWVKSKSKKNSFIVAGDFNILPSDEIYRDIIKIAEPDPSVSVSVSASVSVSSYASATNLEFTNWSDTTYSGGIFKETIDYIFYDTSGFNVIESGALLKTNTICPNKNVPSDHLPIYADFELH